MSVDVRSFRLPARWISLSLTSLALESVGHFALLILTNDACSVLPF